MDVKYQVFVSSTFIDLQDERRGVIEQILNLGHIPIGMELFQAGDETQWSYIKRRILESDYYVLIMAERYGSEGQTGKSYTQMEYEFAIKNKIPTISFLLHSDARKSWPQSKIEFDKIAKVNKFRSLCEKKLVKHWRNVDDLNTKVIGSLVELIRERPMTGWVRADSVATSLALSEMSRLLEEKRILQEKLDRYEGENTTLKIPAEIQFHINSLKSKLLAEFIETEDNNFEIPEISMMETFLILSRALSTGSTEWNIKRRLAGELEISGMRIEISDVLAEYASRGLVGITHVQEHEFSKPHTEVYFTLTDTGKKLLLAIEYQKHIESSHPEMPET